MDDQHARLAQRFDTALDHLVVTAGSREAGMDFVSALLGVRLQEGGEHPRMGTHNALLRLGDTAYLEVLAPNPNVPAPSRGRWFNLDRPDAQPRLAAWVVRTNDIHRASNRAAAPLGQVEPMTRGNLSWLITVPPNGELPWDGVVPTIIQWSTPLHPARLLPDAGCVLEALEIRHGDADRLEAMLADIGFDGPVEIARPSSGHPVGLRARIRTPGGVVVLGGLS